MNDHYSDLVDQEATKIEDNPSDVETKQLWATLLVARAMGRLVDEVERIADVKEREELP